MSAREKLIVALDVPALADALRMVDMLGDAVLWYKVGLELYLAEGEPAVRALKERGKRVFLDLKLHDIPNTVAAATRVAARTGADLLTVHAGGGPAMLRAAVDAAGTSLQVLAVTVLTSMDGAELEAVGVAVPPGTHVSRLARMAAGAGVHGLVCSPLEVGPLRGVLGEQPLLVVPGIRGAEDAKGDQQRTASAAEAVASGASMVVVGRPITRAQDPVQVVERLLCEIEAI